MDEKLVDEIIKITMEESKNEQKKRSVFEQIQKEYSDLEWKKLSWEALRVKMLNMGMIS